MTAPMQIKGERFGNLTVLDRVPCPSHILNPAVRKRSFWLCVCDCGNERIVEGQKLTNDRAVTCGCRMSMLGDLNKSWRGVGHVPGWVWSGIVKGAKSRSIPIEVTIEDASCMFEKQDGRCALSGIQLSFGTNKRGRTASLDRIENSLGYVAGNIQWLHKTVNQMKSMMPEEEFVSWCRLIAEHTQR